MKKLYGLLCALTLAAFVPMCAAADATPATGKDAPAAAAPAATAPAAPTPGKTAAAAPMSDKEKMSYAIGARMGMQFGMQVKSVNLDLDLDVLCQGIHDALTGKTLALPPDEIQSSLDKMSTEVKQKQQERMKEIAAMGEKNKVEGPKFLAENKKKDGVVTLPSGLQYKVLKEGEGKLPGPTDIMTVNYRGMFPDGKEFDSSKPGSPLVVPLDGSFIAGMTEGLKLMKVGSKWLLFVPPELAYKEDGRPPIIAPNAVLIFEVEVLGIEAKPAKAPEK